MFWFKLKNNLKLIMSALWDDKEKFTKLKNEIEIQSAFQRGGQVDASKLWGDKFFTKVNSSLEDIERQQDLDIHLRNRKK